MSQPCVQGLRILKIGTSGIWLDVLSTERTTTDRLRRANPAADSAEAGFTGREHRRATEPRHSHPACHRRAKTGGDVAIGLVLFGIPATAIEEPMECINSRLRLCSLRVTGFDLRAVAQRACNQALIISTQESGSIERLWNMLCARNLTSIVYALTQIRPLPSRLVIMCPRQQIPLSTLGEKPIRHRVDNIAQPTRFD
jgi:hypothetical protein